MASIGLHASAAHFVARGSSHHSLDLKPWRRRPPLWTASSKGSILSERHLREALEEVDTVIQVHRAAVVEEGGDVERFNKLIVDGARLVAEVAKAQGAERFLHLSSVMVYGFNFPD